MNLAQLAPPWLAALLVALLAAAAIDDSRRLRISNWITGAILLLAIVAAALVGPTIALWQNLLVLVAMLTVGTFLFSAGAFGGGDIKLLAATGAWFSLGGAWRMILLVLLAGGVVALLILLLRLFGWTETMRERVVILRAKGGIPYGIAIALGAIAMIALQRRWL